jgi:hypothetical protein
MSFRDTNKDLAEQISGDLEDMRKVQQDVSILSRQVNELAGATTATFLGLLYGSKTVQSGDVALTTAYQTLITQTITLPLGGTLFIVGTFNFVHTAAGAGVAQGQCLVNGAAQIGVAKLQQTAVEGTVAQTWSVAVTPGEHTVVTQAEKTINAGTVVAQGTHTGLLVVVFGLAD